MVDAMNTPRIENLDELKIYMRISHAFACDYYNDFKGDEKATLDTLISRGLAHTDTNGIICDDRMPTHLLPDTTHHYIETDAEYRMMSILCDDLHAFDKTLTYLFTKMNPGIRSGAMNISRMDISHTMNVLTSKGLVEQYITQDPITLAYEPTYRAIGQFKVGCR